jgi:hypothetical protein
MALPLIASLLSLSSLTYAAPLASNSTSPCAKVAAATGKYVDAELGYQCLKSIPFKADAAEALVRSLQPYLEFQSTLKSIENPPAEYAIKVQPPYSILGAMEKVLANVQSNSYTSEYDVS